MEKIQKTIALLLWPLLVLAFLLPIAINAINKVPLIKSQYSYAHLSIAKQAQVMLPFDMLLSFFSVLPEWFLVVNAALLLLSMFIIQRIPKRQKHERLWNTAVVLFAVSPLFQAFYHTTTPLALSLMLTLALYLFQTRQKAILTTITYILLLILGPIHALIATALLIGKHYKNIKIMLPLGVGIITSSSTFFFTKISLEAIQVSHIISDLGGFAGISFFAVLLAGIGLIPIYKQNMTLQALLIVLAVVIGIIFSKVSTYYIGLVLIGFASLGFCYFFDREWKTQEIKQLTLLLLVLGVLFSAISYIDRSAQIAPTNEIKEQFSWLEENTQPAGVLLSEKESYFLSYFTKHTHLTDKLFKKASSATYISELFPILEQENIKYIFISPEWRKQLKEDEGLRFLLNNERFKLLHSSNQTQIWQFVDNE